jgi:two-component system invasion response regulator UvrY
MEKISILIADDHTLVRETWGFVVNSDNRFNVVAECANGEEAVELSRRLQPNVVMMDINLPGMNGIEATEQIRNFSPGSKILGISVHSEPAFARKMFQKGALGYLTKNSSREEMFKAILEVSEGRKYICSEIKNKLSDQLLNTEGQHTGINSLSQREIEIIRHVKKGLSSKEIANELNISVKTVEVHRHNIFKKFDLKNVASLIHFINNHPEFPLHEFE